MRILIVILTLFAPLVAAHAAGPCLSFEPAVESIAGTLVRETFPGRPNFESIKTGDEPETGWYVRLPEPICVKGTPGDVLNGEDVIGVKLLQLVLTHGEYKTHDRLVGEKVKATGTLFAAFTGHHHTPVLLQVRTLEPEK